MCKYESFKSTAKCCVPLPLKTNIQCSSSLLTDVYCAQIYLELHQHLIKYLFKLNLLLIVWQRGNARVCWVAMGERLLEEGGLETRFFEACTRAST